MSHTYRILTMILNTNGVKSLNLWAKKVTRALSVFYKYNSFSNLWNHCLFLYCFSLHSNSILINNHISDLTDTFTFNFYSEQFWPNQIHIRQNNSELLQLKKKKRFILSLFLGWTKGNKLSQEQFIVCLHILPDLSIKKLTLTKDTDAHTVNIT